MDNIRLAHRSIGKYSMFGHIYGMLVPGIRW